MFHNGGSLATADKPNACEAWLFRRLSQRA